MRVVRIHLYALVLLLLIGPQTARAQTDSQAAEDEKLLKAAGVAVDGPGLVEFFRKRIPTDDTTRRIEALMKELGDRHFKVREKAAADLIAVGPPALGALRQAARTADLETQRRARQCIQAIEKRNAPEAVTAAARLLRARRGAGACAALLNYLPSASNEAAEEILETVFVLGGTDGKVDPAVSAALKDPASARRAAAALVLGRYGTTEQRRAVQKLLADQDLTIRFRAAQGLLAGGDRSAVPVLVELLDKAPLPLAQHAEDLLICAAGSQVPKVSLGEDEKKRAKCRAAWEAWWSTNKDKLDLTKADLRSVFSDPKALARTISRRFIEALMKQDRPTLRKTIDAPFVIDPILVMQTREEVENLLAGAPIGKEDKVAFRITGVLRLSDYNRQITKRTKAARRPEIEKILSRQGEIWAVVAAATVRGSEQRAAVLVRVRGGRAWVVGVGELGPTKGPK